MVAAKINFQQGAKRNLKPMEIKEKHEHKGKNQPPNSSKGNSSNNKAKEKGVYKGKNRLTPEELVRYRKDNQCFKCGEQGHAYQTCPQRNARNEQPRASIIEAPKEDVHCKGLVTAQSLVSGLLVSNSVSGFLDYYWLVSSFLHCDWTGLVSLWFLVQDWLAVQVCLWFRFRTGSGPSARTQGSATQDPHIAASDSSSDFDVMEGYPMQQHPESSSQDMHALGQQPGISMFSRLKETLSRATRSEHATNEINEGGGEVDSPFASQRDPVLSESVHVSTPATTPIGLSKLTPSETLLPDDRSLAEVQEVERYILAAREKEIESLRKAEQRRATLAKAPMTSTNPLQSLELTTLTSQPIGSHIASGSKDTPNTSILDGVFLNENWEYNLQTEKLTDLYTSYTYHVGWLDVIQPTSNSTSVDEQQRMICDVIHSIVQMERQNLGINMPSMGPMRFLDTTKAKQPTISQMETPSDTANTIYTDSQSALGVERNPIFHARTKHIEVHYHNVRERLSAGEINLAYVPTQDNLADLFTKALSREKLEAFRKALGLLSFVD
ncbi:hypothetical protein L7F22_034326 [Adiantum nelumboides]|nr:hypothetical protein [Adiantum nelumboides]